MDACFPFQTVGNLSKLAKLITLIQQRKRFHLLT
jgi:hypothetical protein